ncbi:hypothetical protein BGZ76_006333, partial [Entomortierella beljakovae]
DCPSPNPGKRQWSFKHVPSTSPSSSGYVERIYTCVCDNNVLSLMDATNIFLQLGVFRGSTPNPNASSSSTISTSSSAITSTSFDSSFMATLLADVSALKLQLQELHKVVQAQAGLISQLQAEKVPVSSQVSIVQHVSKVEAEVSTLKTLVTSSQDAISLRVSGVETDVSTLKTSASAVSKNYSKSSTSKQSTKTYAAAAALHGFTEEQQAVLQAMRPPPRAFAASKPDTGIPYHKANPMVSLTQVYVGNIVSCPLRELKSKLKALGFQLGKIHNISFIARTIAEFLVEGPYKNSFVTRMQECSFRYLPGYDPSQAMAPDVSPEVQVKIKEAFRSRLLKSLDGNPRPPVREAFLRMAASSGVDVGMPLIPPDSAVAETSSSTNDIQME